MLRLKRCRLKATSNSARTSTLAFMGNLRGDCAPFASLSLNLTGSDGRFAQSLPPGLSAHESRHG